MFLVEVSLVFSMKPANTKLLTVPTYTFLACILPEVRSLCRSLFFFLVLYALGFIYLFLFKRTLTPEWKQWYLSSILGFVFSTVW